MPVKFIDENDIQGASDGAMTRAEFLAAISKFATYFKTNGTSAVSDSRQSISYSAMNALANSGSDESLVLIWYGMDNSLRLVYGFSFVTGVAQADGSISYNGGTAPTHTLAGGTLVPVTATSWAKLESKYYSTVQVERTHGSGFVPLNSLDTKRTVLPWKVEIQLMYTTNVGAKTDCRLIMESLSLVHTSGDGGNAGYRQGVAFYTEQLIGGVYVPMMDNTHYVSIYKNKAADFGALCPPDCAEFKR